MDLSDQLSQVETRQELAEFVRALKTDLESHADDWENVALPAFLGAVSAWIEDMDGYYANKGQRALESPSWRTLGEMLLAAKYYE